MSIPRWKKISMRHVQRRQKEELLLPKDHLDKLWAIRKSMSDSPDFLERFLKKLKQTKSNEEFFAQLGEELKSRR